MVCLAFLLILSTTALVSAQNYSVMVSTTQEVYAAGKNVTFQVSLLDENNNPVDDQVSVIIQDLDKRYKIEKVVSSKDLNKISLAEGGYWEISAEYKGATDKRIFRIEEKELIKAILDGSNLIITNIGNIKSTQTIYIIIGDEINTKTPTLNIGESASYKLVAPEGDYDLRVENKDHKVILSKSGIRLTGTGNVVGAISDQEQSRAGITGGVAPEEGNEFALLNYVKNSLFVYMFMLVIFGAAILLAIEKRISKRAK